MDRGIIPPSIIFFPDAGTNSYQQKQAETSCPDFQTVIFFTGVPLIQAYIN